MREKIEMQRFIILILIIVFSILTSTTSTTASTCTTSICQTTGEEDYTETNCSAYIIMKPDLETLHTWIEMYNNTPKAFIDPKINPHTSFSLLNYLQYNPYERDQGYCGNCWVWAGTGVLEIALSVQEGIKDRLSVQYFTSCWPGNPTSSWACCGGWLNWFAEFYRTNGFAIPWSNSNAHWQDGGSTCGDTTSTSCGDITTSPRYFIDNCTAKRIETYAVEKETAINNIKNILHQRKAIWFTYFLPTGSDWNNFYNFWNNEPENAIWNPNFSCGHTWDAQGGGHAVLCVGYNDTDPNNSYWIMLNSWNASTNRPNGIFYLDMNMNYNCSYVREGTTYQSFFWQTLDVVFKPELNITSPTQSNWASAGAFDNPSHIEVTVEVKEGNTPITGLTIANFTIKIGGKEATASIIDTSIPGRYVFDVSPPQQESPGCYDLEVILKYKGIEITDTEKEAVCHTKGYADVMLIIDRSGSMWGQKIAVARNSAK